MWVNNKFLDWQLDKLLIYSNIILIKELLKNTWDHVFPKPDSMSRHFTRVGYGKRVKGEHEDLIFPHKFRQCGYNFEKNPEC